MAFQKFLRTVVITLGATLLATKAHAGLISDATIRNTSGGLDAANAVLMGKGKVKKANVNLLTGEFAGDAWSLLDRTNKSSTPFNGVNFVLNADTGQRSGEWGLNWVGVDVPEYMDFVLVLKSRKMWAAFLFESASLAPQELGGGFNINWLNKKGKVPKLRRAFIFGRTVVAPVDPYSYICSCSVVITNVPVTILSGAGGAGHGVAGNLAVNDVPTPGTLALLAMGLVLILMQLRQRRKR